MVSVENLLPGSKSYTEEEEACMFAMQLASFSALPMTLRAAIELNLLEIITRAGPGAYLSPIEIATQLPTENPEAPDLLDRMLSLLASYKVLTCSVSTNDEGGFTRRYGATPVSKILTNNEHGISMRGLSLVCEDKAFMESWYYLKDAVLEGVIPFNKAYGMSLFEYLGTDPRLSASFNEGMQTHSTMIMSKILERYGGFDNVRVLVDVGGGIGGSIGMIVGKHPHLKGINFDLPSVIAQAPAIQGIEHVGGDMFSSVPNGDAIFLKWILHNWSDEHCIKLLKNCWEALLDNGKLIIVESIVSVVPESTLAAQGVFHDDILMLARCPGGKERTEEKFKDLAKQAGFSGFRALFSYSHSWVMELSK